MLVAPAGWSSPTLAWHLRAVGAEEAWASATGSGVTVAVIDSGVDADHPDLAGRVLPGRSFIDADRGAEPRLLALGADPGPAFDRAFAQADPVGHGTAVAGLIAGRSASRHPGVAPGARILPVRVLDDQNRYHDSAMVGEAVRWAVDNGADVVNLSLGGHYDSQAFAEAIDYAERRDVLVVACTGNQEHAGSGDAVWFPAREDPVLAVTGVDSDGLRWPTAITGDETDLAAPSARLTVPAAGGGHKTATGTSFASAIVSGTAALVRSARPELSAAEVRHLLTATAGADGEGLGAGVVDAARAVEADLDRLPPPPFEASTRQAVSPLWVAAVTGSGAAMLCAAALLLRSRSRVAARRSASAA
ncbi:S8 family serine peptidase [Glycomyces sp. L485]|uniref:S8 family serine peptidase n=1 Tax=Glycomyces sp. L485 TaxID=2909235 RepID=UPI001F4B6F53|nr:S8 family serine peptidase [Glycomyces sp. L485]MCH7230654.1 S8 family serine peptidase [Glycomyces sp. L485]